MMVLLVLLMDIIILKKCNIYITEMNNKIVSACNECLNELYDYIYDLEKVYQRLQKELHDYKFEKHGFVNENRDDFTNELRFKIRKEIYKLSDEIRKMLEKQFK